MKGNPESENFRHTAVEFPEFLFVILFVKLLRIQLAHETVRGVEGYIILLTFHAVGFSGEVRD